MKQLKQLKERYEEAQAEADAHRVAYHDEVARLHSEGTSLRDIADALGVSHQRIHQIVGPRNLLECSFCSKLQSEVSKLVAGPGVYICNECVFRADGVIRLGTQRSGRIRAVKEELRETETLICSFCKKRGSQVEAVASGPGVFICNECIDLCREIIDN